ncbi:hypothetical protein HK104_006150, partial [Borealophlyctis nickersoniae]
MSHTSKYFAQTKPGTSGGTAKKVSVPSSPSSGSALAVPGVSTSSTTSGATYTTTDFREFARPDVVLDESEDIEFQLLE